MVKKKRVEIIIVSSSIIKRSTVSQMLEAAYAMHVHKNMSNSYSLSVSEAMQSFMNQHRVRNRDVTRVL